MASAVLIGEAPGPDWHDESLPLGGRIGRRLERLAGLSEGELPYVFALGNLLSQPQPYDGFDMTQAYKNWAGFADEMIFEFSHVVLLGGRVRQAAGYLHLPWMRWVPRWEVQIAAMPHPSGRNLWWNSAENTRRAERFLRDLVAVLDDEKSGPPPKGQAAQFTLLG